MKHAIIALTAWALGSPAYAASIVYACTVQLTLTVDDNGVPNQADRFAAAPGIRFIVDRTTGRFYNAEMFDNATGENVILDEGDKDTSFRVLNRVGFRTNYLEVHQFIAGQRKPFVMIDYGDIYTGLCE